MARSRFAIIITALSLLGFTLTPHAYFPCCCKGGGKTAQPAGPAPCCPVQKPVKSCCAGANSVATCTADDTLTRNCPTCRCLEQMQVPVLTGPNAGDTTTRVFAALPASALPNSLTAFADAAEVARMSDGPPGMAILLKTCTLVC